MPRIPQVSAVPPAQKQLELTQPITVGPLQLIFLLAIYNGEFDKRLHRGEFQHTLNFECRVAALLDMELVKYSGFHYLTAKGKEYVERLLEVKP